MKQRRRDQSRRAEMERGMRREREREREKERERERKRERDIEREREKKLMLSNLQVFAGRLDVDFVSKGASLGTSVSHSTGSAQTRDHRVRLLKCLVSIA